MQTRDEFVAERSGRWAELESLLMDDRNLYALKPTQISRAVTLYRSVCADLMRAKSLGCGPDVTFHLDAIASRAHNALYGPRPYRLSSAWQLVTAGFPRTLRRRLGFFLLSLLLFGSPFALGVAGALHSSEFAYGVIPAEMLQEAAENYKQGFAEGRGSGEDAMMAGFYVYNNVGIAFRCFATGVLFGLGSVFFLLYNGLLIGTLLGHVIASGAGHNILTFVCGHAPFELTAIVVSGGAGLQMGWALVDTRGKTRIGSLRGHAKELLELVVGAALMLIVAAVIEGFWSPSTVSPSVKWAFSAFGWLLVIVYFALGGRRFRRHKVVAR